MMNIIETILSLKHASDTPCRFLLVDYSHREEIANYIMNHDDGKGLQFFYNSQDVQNTRIFGLSTKFLHDYHCCTVFGRSNPPNELCYTWIQEYDQYCKDNTLQYNKDLMKNVYSKDEVVEVSKQFLYELSCFLTASSHLSDEGRLPYFSFEQLSHKFGHDIAKHINMSSIVAQTQYIVADQIYEDKISDIKFNN